MSVRYLINKYFPNRNKFLANVKEITYISTGTKIFGGSCNSF
jgi:hypothetical protein